MGQTVTISKTWHKHFTDWFWDMPLLKRAGKVISNGRHFDQHLDFAENSFFANTVGTSSYYS